MIKRLFFAAIALLIFALPALAKHVDVETAKTVARTFWTQNHGKQTRATFSDVTSQTEFTNFYIFNADGGFVIVSADNIAHPILGYSDEGNFDPQNIPVNVRGWLIGYENEIGWGISNGVTASAEIAAEWEKLSNGQGLAPKRSGSVNPLIQTQWSQFGVIDQYCPYDSIGGGRSCVGCVALAMAQIMKYWSYPIHGIGSHSYTCLHHPEYGVLSADFENTTYDWDNMLNIYRPSATQEQQDAVATLAYHCGVAVEMIYGYSASAAITLADGTSRPCAENALKNYFGYKTTIQGLHRNNYTDTDWKNMLKAELDARRPIIYDGADDQSGGHAWICDGYDANNYFHFNWGWGGSDNGFYLVNELTPGGGGTVYYTNYNNDESAIIGIEPNINLSDSLVSNPSALYFNSEGGNVNFAIKSNNNVAENWTAVSSTEWLTLSVTSGDGNGAVTIVTATANENPSRTDRNATITITHGSETKVINVMSRRFHWGEFYLNLIVNDSTLGFLPDLNGWHPSYNSYPTELGIGDILRQDEIGISSYISAHTYPNARFMKWNYYGDSTGIGNNVYPLYYCAVNFDYEGYNPQPDTLTVEAIFAPVHNGDTLIYDNGSGSPSGWFVKSAPYDTTTYYRWGVKYDPSALGGVTQIPQVEMRLGPDGSEACNYTIQLWQGGDDSPQTLIHTQTSSIRSYYEWRVISFDTPVAIDSTLPLWVTISCTRSLHSSPLTAYDNCGNPNSNYIWIPGTGWTHIDDCSWAIRAYTAVPTGRIVTTYVDYWDNHDTEARDCYVTGGGTYEVGSSVTLTAVPDSSHCFKSWSGEYSDYPHGEIPDVHENPVTFTVNRNVTYYAHFSDEADLYVYSSDYSYGTAHVEGYTYSPTLAVGSTTTITAVPATSHIGFNHWEWHYTNNPSVVYQVTENPYTFRVTGDAEYTAFFNVLPVNITAGSNNYDYGNVTGGGIYDYGQYVSLTASPLAGYGFDHWEWYTNADPTNVHQSTDNPVNFYAEEDVNYTAIFVPTIHITTLVNNPLWGNVTPSGDYVPGRTVTLTAEPYGNTVNFIYWEWYYDDNPSNVYQNTSNPLSFIALGDATYKAYFDGSISISHVTVRANNDAWGHVSGSGDYQSNESVMLRAEPYDGYRFLHWVWEEYGMTLEGNPFNFALYPGADSEITFTGYFESLTGVDETNTDDIRIYSLDGCIIVEGADGETVTIYDMTGRIVRDCGLPNGVYMVKVGERAPRKVVVAK